MGAEITKRTMTLNLSEDEMRVLDSLAQRKDLSKTAVIRQALRVYEVVCVRRDRGEKLLFENDQTKEKAELMLL